jgi:peptidoglycan/LPS O-acetylase OafA/YrhL
MVSCVALVLVPVFMFVFPYCFGWDGHASTSLAASLNFLVVCVLVFLALPVLLVGRATGRISELLGNLSYPIFLTHWYAAYLCWSLLGLKRGTFTYALVSLLVSLCISYLIILLVENPIASIRQRYRLKRSV